MYLHTLRLIVQGPTLPPDLSNCLTFTHSLITLLVIRFAGTLLACLQWALRRNVNLSEENYLTLQNDILQSKAKSTIKSYLSCIRKWEAWASEHRFSTFPANDRTVALFLSELSAHRGPNCLSQYYHALVWIHRLSGDTNLRRSTICTAVIESTKRKASRPVARKRALQLVHLQQIAVICIHSYKL